ncbi:hypothetical protein ACFL3V_06615 [Nanoarchaeota archaeon]
MDDIYINRGSRAVVLDLSAACRQEYNKPPLALRLFCESICGVIESVGRVEEDGESIYTVLSDVPIGLSGCNGDRRVLLMRGGDSLEEGDRVHAYVSRKPVCVEGDVAYRMGWCEVVGGK